jgi:hypothetical protein
MKNTKDVGYKGTCRIRLDNLTYPMGTFKSLVEALLADAGVSKFRKALRSLLSFASPRSVKSARAINREAINSRAASG